MSQLWVGIIYSIGITCLCQIGKAWSSRHSFQSLQGAERRRKLVKCKYGQNFCNNNRDKKIGLRRFFVS